MKVRLSFASSYCCENRLDERKSRRCFGHITSLPQSQQKLLKSRCEIHSISRSRHILGSMNCVLMWFLFHSHKTFAPLTYNAVFIAMSCIYRTPQYYCSGNAEYGSEWSIESRCGNDRKTCKLKAALKLLKLCPLRINCETWQITVRNFFRIKNSCQPNKWDVH